ncbi:uncharacterized protein LOC131272651 [Anopheles coustani]|uniref:uncharacterized protein LOC131272651 n=1 Tax=Anopheles coustani TaxID=139045 RepID=UPI0026583D73|nr:uncharacterized protein LOC131272651 [Anopheles coustani]
MSDPTCFKFTVNSNIDRNDVRTWLQTFGPTYQVFVAPYAPDVVNVKYKEASSAMNAKRALQVDRRVASIEPMDNWPFHKRSAESSSSEQKSKSSSKSSDPVSQDSTMREDLLDGCVKCRKIDAGFMCGICFASYCSQKCRDDDFAKHRKICKAPLIIKHRPHPSLYSDGEPKAKSQQQEKEQKVKKVNQPSPKPNTEQFEQKSEAKAAGHVAVSNGPKKNPATEKRVPQKNIENEPQVKQQPQQEQLKKVKQALEELQNKPQTPILPEKTSNRAAVPENTKKTVQQEQQQKREQNQVPDPTQASNASPQQPSNASPQQPSSTLLKRMQKKAATTKRTIAYDPFPPVGSKVAISSVSNKLLHIHEVYGGNDDPFLSFITRCMKHADEIDELLQQPPQEGDIVFAPFDDCFYRAVVTKVEGNDGTVVFPDFGNLVTLPWRQMKEIRDASVKYANCLTHAVALREGAPFSTAVEHFLNELVEAHQFELTLVEDGPTSGVKTVELRHVESQYLLGAKVRSMTTPAVKTIKLEATDPATYKPVYESEFDEASLRSDIQQHEEQELVIVEASEFATSHQVGAILAKSEAAFANMMRECQEYGQLDRNEYLGEPEHNYGCLVNYEGAWIRAVKLTADCENQFFLIDLGLFSQLDKSCPKRRYPPGLTRKLFCSEYHIENTDFLTKEMIGSSNLTDDLRGMKVKAKVYFDEESELFRMKIISIIKR